MKNSQKLSIEEDNLVVILTPYVIDKSEKLSQLQEDLGTLAKLQVEYNIDVFNKLKKLKDEKDKKEDEE